MTPPRIWPRPAPRATVPFVPSPRLLAAPLALALLACEAPATHDDEQVARDTVAALTGSSAQLQLYDGLLGPVNLKGITLALAPTRVIEQVRGGLDEALADRGCLEIDTDKTHYLDLRFTDCRYRGVHVDGALRIELTTETGDCDGAPCLLATRYTTTITALEIGPTQIHSARSVLRISEIKGEGRSYTAEVDLIDRNDRPLHLRHELTWRRQGGCTYAELGAKLTVDGREINAGAEGIEVCGDRCPRAGQVQVAWANGRAIAWSYDGTPEITVQGPRGREFTVELDCEANEP